MDKSNIKIIKIIKMRVGRRRGKEEKMLPRLTAEALFR